MSEYTVGYYVAFGVVLLPLYMALLGWFTGRPRDPRKALLGVGYLLGITVAILAFLWVMGAVLGVFVPG